MESGRLFHDGGGGVIATDDGDLVAILLFEEVLGSRKVELLLRQVVTDPTIRLAIATLLLLAMLAWFSVGRRRTAS